MKVSSAGHQLAQKMHHQKAQHIPPGQQKVKAAKEPSALESPEAIQAEAVEDQDKDGSKGVLRHLQSGHFKGVAELRLRINFHDELQALGTEQMTNMLEEKSTSIVAGIEERVQNLPLEGIAGADELLAEFQTASSNIFSPSETPPTPEMVVAELEAAFGQLVESLNLLVAPEPAVDEPVMVETSEDDSPLAAAMVELQDWFSSQIEGLKTEVDSIATLPTLSGPRGNGAAYDKFLAIYNDMMGTGGQENEQQESELPIEQIDYVA